MNRYQVTAKFPQALSKDCFQSTTVDATTFAIAADRGLKNLMSRPGIKGKRHSNVQVTIIKFTEDHDGAEVSRA
jgi:hypothetical protein